MRAVQGEGPTTPHRRRNAQPDSLPGEQESLATHVPFSTRIRCVPAATLCYKQLLLRVRLTAAYRIRDIA